MKTLDSVYAEPTGTKQPGQPYERDETAANATRNPRGDICPPGAGTYVLILMQTWLCFQCWLTALFRVFVPGDWLLPLGHVSPTADPGLCVCGGAFSRGFWPSAGLVCGSDRTDRCTRVPGGAVTAGVRSGDRLSGRCELRRGSGVAIRVRRIPGREAGSPACCADG